MTNLRGVKKASGESKGLNPRYYQYLQLNYDRRAKKVFTDYHVSLGYNSWTEYDNDAVLVIGNIVRPMTMAEITKMVDEAIAYEGD